MSIQLACPHDIDAERVVLGSIVSNSNDYNSVRDLISEDCFYNQFNKEVFQAMRAIEKSGDNPDLMSIIQHFRKIKGDNIDIVALSEVIQYSTSYVYRDTCHLKDLSVRRKLIDIGNYVSTKANDESFAIDDILSYTEDETKNIFSTSINSVSTIKEAVKSVYEIIERNQSDTAVMSGTPTGFDKFDAKSGGLQKSDLIIIAAETSQGKTSLALSIGNNAALQGHSIAMYSLEMKKEQLASRLMAMNSGIPANQIIYSRLEPYQFERLDKSVSGLINSKILFDDRSTSNIDVIINSIRSMKIKHNIEGVIIDYLQILNVNMKGSNKEQQMADVARRLKNLAKDLDIWIIALSQLNRDNLNPVPNLNRLRDSGQIAEAADIVMFVYRPEYYGKSFPEPFTKYQTQGYAMIDVAKGRNIGLLKMLCEFNKETTHFVYVDESEVPISNSLCRNQERPF